MSDPIHHECGLAFIRLKKPLAYYNDKYGTPLWGFQRLYLLMEKQHNRGQDGIGIGCCKLNAPLGKPYLFRERNAKRDSLIKVMEEQLKEFAKLARRGKIATGKFDDEGKPIIDPEKFKDQFDFGGEVLLGHLRYGTSGRFGAGGCHPFVKRTSWPTKTLMVAGNFNMTNARNLNHHLIQRGQHPIFDTDTQTVIEEISFHLEEAHDAVYHRERDAGTPGETIPQIISRELDLRRILEKCGDIWDGGYAIAGLIGNGDGFVLRDPNGIRPCHYYEDEEVIAFASERVPLMTVFGCDKKEVRELDPGHVAVMKRQEGKVDVELKIEAFTEPAEYKPCSFERIYFSRGNDPTIYKERHALGHALVPQIRKAIDDDFGKSVFSFVPNTAEIGYHGMMDGLRRARREQVRDELLAAVEDGSIDADLIDKLIMGNWPKGEKIAHKDIKLRTFINQEKGRDQMVSHVYDITYGIVKPDDCLVAIDDSIVRGTTLQKSILKILARTNPRKIVIVSTAPQVRYPDCYGIDMSELGKFIAFRAAISLLEKTGQHNKTVDVYLACKEELKKPVGEQENCVKQIYEPFTAEQISDEIAEIVRPKDGPWKGEVEVIYQTIENLHDSIPVHNGDWYFSGDYPTKGGTAIANQAYISWQDGSKDRPYDMLPLS
ncbi:MAG: amidophosphoribosyltransferase [Verrucomicrobiales bacterium]|nr:amidophosphoribosyltransferase [Verrucomicrobiales bacterium]